ncbi:MAG: PAS domain S-box protein, partial [Chlorobiaceae bacterium]
NQKKLWNKTIHSLFDNFQDPIFLLDRDCTILAANQAFCDMVGKTLEELINTNGLELLPPELQKSRRQRVEEVMVSRKPLFFEDEQYGEILRSSLYPINEDGEKLLVIVQNITKTRVMEQKIKSQEAFNQAIINSIPGIFYIVDHNGQFVGGNDNMRETIIGNSGADLDRVKVLDLLHPDDREQGIAVLERLIDQNSPAEPFEGRLIQHGGPEYRWYLAISHQAVIDGVDYIIGVGIDINDHKAAELALIESEERFRKLFESHAAAKMVIDAQTGSIIDANQAAAAFYGWTVEELKKMNINQIIVPSDEEIQQNIENASSRHRTADGSLRDVEVYSNKIEANGKLLIYGIIIDVTERKRLESLADGIIVTDTQGTITSISPMALILFEAKDKAELLAKPFTALVHTRDTKKWQDILQEEPEKAASIRTLELLCKKGREEATFLAEITVLQIHDVYGALQSYQLIIRDITLHKLNENQQLHTSSLIALGEMASGVAHEITQPVNNISLLADKMLEKAKSDSLDIKNTVTKQAQKIVQNIARLQTIVDNILHFASKEQKCVTTRFDCKEPIHSAHTLTSKECTKKSIELTFHCDPEELPVKGNLYKMEQVILNLIRNSIDAIEEKRHKSVEPGTEMYIHLQAKRQKESVIISIADNGIGISRQNIDYILQPFFTTKESGKGTGLGLSISSGIIKEMHGQLNVTSTPMQGTTVQLSLPLATNPPAG